MSYEKITDDIKKYGGEVIDNAAIAGKIYGTLINIVPITIYIIVLIFSIKLIITNSKYIETKGTVVSVKDPCIETPIYDKNNNIIGKDINCKMIVKFKLENQGINLSKLRYVLPSMNNQITILGLRDDGFYYQEFDSVNNKYNVGDNVPVFYFSEDPFKSATLSYTPTFIGWLGVIISSLLILYSVIKIFLLFKSKFFSTLVGINLGKKIISGGF